MFDFRKFYHGLLNSTDYFDNYWDQFTKGQHLRFKEETLSLLKDDVLNSILYFISNNSKSTAVLRKKEYPFGAFLIETQNKNLKKCYVLGNAKASIQYFNNLAGILETKNKSIAKELREIIARIE